MRRTVRHGMLILPPRSASTAPGYTHRRGGGRILVQHGNGARAPAALPDLDPPPTGHAVDLDKLALPLGGMQLARGDRDDVAGDAERAEHPITAFRGACVRMAS